MTMQKKRQACRKNDAGLLIWRVVSDTRQKQTMRHPPDDRRKKTPGSGALKHKKPCPAWTRF
jgi:hypothetical protein